MSQIMPSGPWEELDTPTYRIVLIFWGVYKVKRWRSREKHPLKLLRPECTEHLVPSEHLSSRSLTKSRVVW